jgi:cyanophycinase
VAAGLVDRAVAIDENTALVLPAAGAEDFEVIGTGNCWDVRSLPGNTAPSPGAAATVTVSVLRAT